VEVLWALLMQQLASQSQVEGKIKIVSIIELKKTQKKLRKNVELSINYYLNSKILTEKFRGFGVLGSNT